MAGGFIEMESIQGKRSMRLLDMTQGSPVKLILAFAVPLLSAIFFNRSTAW